MSGSVESRAGTATRKIVSGLAIAAVVFSIPFLNAYLQRRARLECPSKVRTDLVHFDRALSDYRRERGVWPRTLDALTGLDADGHAYLRRRTLPPDPWDRPYLYSPPAAPGEHANVSTLGADGRPGGTGDDEDVDSDSFRDLEEEPR